MLDKLSDTIKGDIAAGAELRFTRLSGSMIDRSDPISEFVKIKIPSGRTFTIVASIPNHPSVIAAYNNLVTSIENLIHD